ncbi:hypothetical protein KHP60_15310 [Microvirga sp. 3-52]|uniref:hypothetical protein n=1 Tax=Microvirga sp. 3-52 TaxID=2792425 RepID=UPI001AC9CBF8|nr:hypothetical protein [Microvirga sp. 3-52]MBO1906484.1 hypothetical protein [Microvirga sp. 3-52]MBS7453700.1 hypothetical protein [Microvirga sp. 3-52]
MNKRLSMDKGAWRAPLGPTRAIRDYKAWRTILIDSPKSMKLKAFPKAPAGRSTRATDHEAFFLRESVPTGVDSVLFFAGPHFLTANRIPFAEKCAKHGFLTVS